jgi:predicted nucleotidyltransferase component of viral defense system
VNHYAYGSNIDTVVAERDIVLTYVLKILDEAKMLDSLAFKGGTCLKKIYYGKTTRFSEDLDFTSIDNKNAAHLHKRLKEIFHDKEHYGITFKIEDEHTKEEGVTLSHLAIISYKHEWHSDQFDLEVSYRERPALPVKYLPLKNELYFRYLEFKNFDVPSLNREELMSEKIRATLQRCRPRDVYDLYRYSRSPYNKELVKTLAVIKCWNVHDPFDPKSLLNKIQNEMYRWSDLERLVRPAQLPNRKNLISDTARHYAYLKELKSDLQQIANDSAKHKLALNVKKILSDLKTESYIM